VKWIAALVALNLALVGAGLARHRSSRQAPGRVRVGLVFDIGGLGDKSFNDSAYKGLLAGIEKYGVETRTIEPGDGSERESALRELAGEGYDLVIGVGFIFTDDMKAVATEFPKVKFACVDMSAAPGDAIPANLVGLRFREEEGSYLVGALAALVSKTKTVGFVGGMQIPLIRKFEAGFTAGVAAVCPECQVLSAYAGTEPKAFADPTTGKELALAQYGAGADVIFHASGKTGAGVFTAATQEHRLAIGVDADQFGEAPCCVLTSMVKGVDVAVEDTIGAVVAGTFQGGVRELGLAQGGVGYIYDSRNEHWIPEAVRARVEALRQEIVDGAIVVPFK
jgi:basic membrane protein A